VPKKLYVYAALFRSELSDARGFGWDVPDVSFDWRRMKARKNAEIGRLNGIYEGMLAKSGVHLVRGTAVLEDRHTVVVDCSRKITGAAILLGTPLPRAAPSLRR
jgi:glutathione reductase (NADPH)